jgi:elongation factor G
LLEELLEDIQPSQAEILQDLRRELGADLIVPVFFGVAEIDYGVRPFWQTSCAKPPNRV